MSKKAFILKKTAFTIVLMGTLVLSGCGKSDELIIGTGDEHLNGGISETHEEVIAEGNENSESSENLFQTLEATVNTEGEDVLYYIKDGVDPARAIHRCQSDAENIYLAYGEPDLYVMSIGADEHHKANIDNPEELDVCSVAMDTYGRLHLLMRRDNNEEWFIWQLGENYRIDRVLDISAYFENKQMPRWFFIDKDGNYFLQWLFDRNGILLNSEGELRDRFTLESLGINWTYEAAVGRDGQIYLLYTMGDNNFVIGRLDVESCSIEDGVLLPELLNSDTFSQMSAGTDTNLLLFSPVTGVWAYDNESGIIKNRVPVSDIDFGDNMEFWPLNFLADGRLLLVGAHINNGQTDDILAERFFKYIPVGE